jgi:hypothetical protein|tara:strand:- start:171 stop:626 length:456 start_codon:yes stop_codon:yes gene_type:complete
VILVVTVRGSLRALYSAAAIAGATAGGGPAAGRAMAGYLATPLGKAAMDKAIDFTLAKEDVDTANMAMGGLVSEPTLAMIGEAGPELVLPLTGGSVNLKKPKRKATKYQRTYKKKFKEISSRYKLKSGKWKANGFKRAVSEAHKLTKKALK